MELVARWEEQRKAIDEERQIEQESEKLQKIDEAHDVLKLLTKSKEQGGFGFESMKEFVDGIMGKGSDAQSTANVSRFCRDHGAAVAEGVLKRSKEAYLEFLGSEFIAEKVRKEGAEIQAFLTREAGSAIKTVVDQFSLEKYQKDIKERAPTIWNLLVGASSTVEQQEGGGRRNKELVRVLYPTISAQY
jgi:hypothetical protein